MRPRRNSRLMVRSWRFLSADSAALLFIGLCWLTAIILVNPLGEFPVVDDWAYRLSVKALVEHGEIKFSGWTATNLFSQVFWGALFALPFGASYIALRISTLVAGLLASVAVYRLIREADRPISLALFSGLLLLFNPIFFPLALSFMTDVPFVAAQTGAMLFLLKSLRSGSRTDSVLGWLLGLVALLCRQTAFAIPIAYGGAYLAKYRWSIKRFSISMAPLACFLAAQWAYEYWLQTTGKTPLLFGYQIRAVLPTLTGSPTILAGKLVEIYYYAFFYLGLFLLPISLPAVASFLRSLPPKAALAGTAVMLAAISTVASVVLWRGIVMPIWPHTWQIWGVGADFVGARAPEIFLQIVTVFSACGGVFLVACLAYAGYVYASSNTRETDRQGLVFAGLGAAVLISVISSVNYGFDRYLLPVIPWLALFVSLVATLVWNAKIPRWSLALGGVFLAGMAGYSVANGHNYTAQKRTWAAAIQSLVDQGIPREDIDGTWVFNGEVLYGRFGSKTEAAKDWFRSRDYVVGLRAEPDYVLLRRYPVPYWSIWGLPGPDVLVHGRKPSAQ